MAVSVRFRLLTEWANNSSFAKSISAGTTETFASQDEVIIQAVIEATGGAGETFELGNFTTINKVVVENLSTTAGETVNVRWTNDADATASRVTLPVAASGESSILIIAGVRASTDLVLVSGAGTPACRITVIGT